MVVTVLRRGQQDRRGLDEAAAASYVVDALVVVKASSLRGAPSVFCAYKSTTQALQCAASVTEQLREGSGHCGAAAVEATCRLRHGIR